MINQQQKQDTQHSVLERYNTIVDKRDYEENPFDSDVTDNANWATAKEGEIDECDAEKEQDIINFIENEL